MAREIAENGNPLPSLIPNSTNFFLAEENDRKILGVEILQHKGKVYKIGIWNGFEKNLKD